MRNHAGHAIFTLMLIMFVGTGNATDITIEAPPVMNTGFGGSDMAIPFSLAGSDAVIQLVIVEALDWDVPPWKRDEVPTPAERFEQGLDPLVYVGSQGHYPEGTGSVALWNGRDREGAFVPLGWYRYYLLAFVPGSEPENPDYENDDRNLLYEQAAALASGMITGYYDMQPPYPLEHFTDISATPTHMKLIVDIKNTDEPFTQGDEIGVMSPRGNLVGAFIWYHRLFVPGRFEVYGNDPSTPETDGMLEGESLSFVVWDYQTGIEYPVTASLASGNHAFITGTLDTLTGLQFTETSIADAAPVSYLLEQNHPNPFNPSTTISFTLTEASDVTLSVYSVTGRKVAVLAEGPMSGGSHAVTFDGSGLASGVYVYRLETMGMVQTGRMLMVK